MVSTDALLLGETDKAISLVERFSACFRDERSPIYVVHEIETALTRPRLSSLTRVAAARPIGVNIKGPPETKNDPDPTDAAHSERNGRARQPKSSAAPSSPPSADTKTR